ncbi:neuraminidase-like domain-containing protein [Rhizobium leguminosarum]|uniref:Tc toxin subunit A-related protein n=1 Tax=Rhizobium leguminosarum TaxID=384 RepID=UPI00143F3E1C|nr:neuraminidase-like domain-containing protein [Rhizobium leguminosarum]
MSQIKLTLQNSNFSDFYADNPEFDLLAHDFFANAQGNASLIGADRHAKALETMKAYQRVLRLFPHRNEFVAMEGHQAEPIAERLIAAGLDSAHHIAEMTELQFQRDHTETCGGDANLARAIHQRAVQVRAQLRHLAANLYSTVGSPHFRATMAANIDGDLLDYVESIPSYQELFGGLDYIAVDYCASIFGPAAYFLDIMRITDRYITSPNSQNIPEGYALRARRPDLFGLKLTCANTETPIPSVTVINNILKAKLAHDLKGDPVQALATAPYPFNLPYNQPLAEIRRILAQMDSSLTVAAGAYLAPDPDALGFHDITLAQAALGLSPETVQALATVGNDRAQVNAQYGLDGKAEWGPVTGPGTISIVANSKNVSGTGTDFMKLSAGQQIGVSGAIRTIVDIDAGKQTLVVDVEWGTTATEPYLIYPVTTDLSRLTDFRYRTGNTSFDAIDALFTQNLSPEELKENRGNSFFINDTGEALNPLVIDQSGGGDTANPVVRIGNLSAKRLDRISRFMRLGNATGLSAADLDWLMKTGAAKEFTHDFLIYLASIQQIAAKIGLQPVQAAGFTGLLKSIGRISDKTPGDPFDLIFNPPALLDGQTPYAGATPVPFDPDRPLTWTVGDLTLPGKKGTVAGASTSTVTLDAKASAADGAYNGLLISVIKGAGTGQSAIIESYDGATKTAKLYTDWATQPDTGSDYAITMEEGLEDRLAAALQVRKDDLLLLGRYVLGMKPADSGMMALDMTTLTHLWRLAKFANLNRLTLDEYLLMRELIGADHRFEADPTKALADLQQALEAVAMLRAMKMSAYELAYILTGLQSRYVNPSYRPENLPGFLDNLVSGVTQNLLTAQLIVEQGFELTEADRILTGLQNGGFVDASGIVLQNTTAFAAAAALLPITSADLAASPLISPGEAAAALTELAGQLPALLNDQRDGTYRLTDAYREGETLSFLFADDKVAQPKRAFVGQALDSVLSKIELALYAPLFPIEADKSFVTDDIGPAQSQAIFETLSGLKPPIILPGSTPTLGMLSASYSSASDLGPLFVSPAAGQATGISSYAGETRSAKLSPALLTAADSYSYYRIVKQDMTGAAQGGTKNSVTLADGVPGGNGAYVGMSIELTSGTGAGQTGIIVAYDAKSKKATLQTGWSTVPDNTSAYTIGSILTEGAARGGTTGAIELGLAASDDDNIYTGCRLLLVADPDIKAKTDAVRAILNAQKALIVSVQKIMASSAAAQLAYVAGSIGTFLALTPENVAIYLPFASGAYRLLPMLPQLLTPQPDTGPAPVIAAMFDGFSRTALLRAKCDLSAEVFAAIARTPSLYGLSAVHPLDFADIARIAALRAFSTAIGDDGTGVATYIDLRTDMVGLSGKQLALQRLTGWPAAQIEAVSGYLKQYLPTWAGIDNAPGIFRLAPVFDCITSLAGDAAYLDQIARLAQAKPLGPIAGTVDPALWSRYAAAVSGTLALTNARFHDTEFAEVSDKLNRTVQADLRNALVGFAIWHMQAAKPEIRTSDDLFTFLLIDVETGGCDTTSLIAQAINSVQLYMQRCRLALEPGVLTDQIPDVWWEWMSAYRIWEVNRKIFLYPENYIDPFLRKSATPQFEELLNNLLQSQPTDESVAKAFVRYFDAFESLAGLVQVGGYKFDQKTLEGDQVDEESYLIGRTNTTPYAYHMRQFTRSRLPDKNQTIREIYTWGPWKSLGLTIDAAFATPVVAFDRPFLFWNEIKATKSSAVSSGENNATVSSDTKSVWQILLKYSFRTSTGEWLPAQEMEKYQVIDVMPNHYKPLNDSADLRSSYTQVQRFWKQPYAQQVRRGILATGTLSFDVSSTEATGNRTRFQRQVSPGDHIWCNGQQRLIKAVDKAKQTLIVDMPWITAAHNDAFKVIPRDRNTTSFPAFDGEGRASITAGTSNVISYGTQFTIDFLIGNSIQIDGETRVITAIGDDLNLVVDRNWKRSNLTKMAGTVSIYKGLTSVIGEGTNFEADFAVGDTIVVEGMAATVALIDDATQMAVEKPFPIDRTYENKPFVKLNNGRYIGIPAADGSEKLIVFSGPNIDLATKPPAAEPQSSFEKANPGDDPYLASLNNFNNNLNNSLQLAGIVQRDLSVNTGDVTGQRTLLLNASLNQRQIRLYGSTYTGAPQTSPLIRTNLDRDNSMLFVSPETRPLVGLYWGNSAPGTTQNQKVFGSGDLSLMYHLDADDSFLSGFGNQLGWFLASDSNQSFLITMQDPKSDMVAESVLLSPIWQPDNNSDLEIMFGPYTTSNIAYGDMSFRVTRLTTAVAPELKQRLLVSLDRLLALESQYLPERPFDDYYEIPKGEPPPAVDKNALPPSLMDFNGPYGLYFWEIFFHACLAVAEHLKANQNYEKAKQWYEYIFDPMGHPTGSERHPHDRVWQFRPFRDGMTIPSLAEILNNHYEINLYNNDPFNPDVIAQSRISAYAKATLLKYVDTLIKWADALFTQDTRESINQATNLYVLANNLLGKKPEVVGKFAPPKPMDFDQINTEYGGNIPQFLIDAENSAFAPCLGSGQRYADIPYNEIQAYFGVPDNAELSGYWETIEDRLFKIRHCMNIQGQIRTLALFAPPIDPHAFLQSFGASGQILGGAGNIAYPIANYRFTYLIGVARTMADNVQRLGAALLTALEKKDAEALAKLQVTQQAQILDLTLQVREDEIAQLGQMTTSLQQARANAAARQTHFADLLDDGFLPTEEAQISMVIAAGVTGTIAGVLKTAASIGYAVPQVGSPFAMTYGGIQLGSIVHASAGAAEALSTVLKTTGDVLGIYAANSRRREDWELQRDLAGLDVQQYDAQIAANQTQQKIAQRNLEIEMTRVAQTKAIDRYWSDKFTNEELYQWMSSRLATLHFQAYSLALDFARKAQRAYQFENRSQNTYIAPSYWSDLRKGLTAGEGLSNALNALEGAYVGGGGRVYEITKNISLRQLNPRAFLKFVQTGVASFELTEALFDRDFPGHYKRRIKSVKVTIPALVGPYQNIQATLRQTGNRVILKPDINAVKLLQGEEATVPAGVVESNVRPNQSIALSKGQGDTGTFELDLNAPLYLPFEQTGAISSWELSMPRSNNLIDFGSISDVVFELLYTATDGGDGFRQQVSALPRMRSYNWSSLLQPATQMPADWYAFMTGPVVNAKQTLSLSISGLARPNTSGSATTGVYLRLVTAPGVSTRSANDYVTVTVGDGAPTPVSLNPDGSVYFSFDRAVKLPDTALPVAIGFDLTEGFTPAGLLQKDRKRLSADVLQNLDLALFMSGNV